MRVGKQIEHIFSELYDLPECVRLPYFKIKVLELLLFLETLDVRRVVKSARISINHK